MSKLISLESRNLSRMKWEAEIKRTGKSDLLCFGTADMDFKSAEPILNSIIKVAQEGHLGYPLIKESFYAAIENWLRRISGWEIETEWVSTHVGVYPSSWATIEALTEIGDEIIFQTPVHFCFDMMVRDNGRVPIHNPLINNNGRYEMDFEHLESLINEKTKLFWLCNPHNPVGRAWSKAELEKIGEICVKHNVKIMSDDVYCGLMHESKVYTPIASISKEISYNTITCYSSSKIYNTTGVKQSFVVAENPEILSKYTMSLQKQNLTYGKNVFGLAVTEAALNECDDWVKELMHHVKGNREYLSHVLEKELDNIHVLDADGTYFAWVDVRSLNLSDDELEELFEEKANVIIEVGHKFGTVSKGYFRMNLACKREVLEEGTQRIVKAIKEL